MCVTVCERVCVCERETDRQTEDTETSYDLVLKIIFMKYNFLNALLAF